jgi:hypothetical protein
VRLEVFRVSISTGTSPPRPVWYLQGEALATVIKLSLAAASLGMRPAAPA